MEELTSSHLAFPRMLVRKFGSDQIGQQLDLASIMFVNEQTRAYDGISSILRCNRQRSVTALGAVRNV